MPPRLKLLSSVAWASAVTDNKRKLFYPTGDSLNTQRRSALIGCCPSTVLSIGQKEGRTSSTPAWNWCKLHSLTNGTIIYRDVDRKSNSEPRQTCCQVHV